MIVVITDCHANLPILDTAFVAIDREGYDAIGHTGDALAIGPYHAHSNAVIMVPIARRLAGLPLAWHHSRPRHSDWSCVARFGGMCIAR